MASQRIFERSGIALKDTWNLEPLFSSQEIWEEEFKRLCGKKVAPFWPSLEAFKGSLGQSAQRCKEALEAILDLERKLEKLYTYAHLRHDEEITHDKHKSAYLRILSKLSDFRQETAWFEPQLLELPEEIIKKYLASPELAPYCFYLQKIVRLRPHTLPREQEELLAIASKAFAAPPKAFSALNNADLKFADVKDSGGTAHPLSHGLYQLYLRSTDRQLRKNAFEEMQRRYLSCENTFSELLSGEVESHIVSVRARHYPSSLEAAIFPFEIPQSVYRNLIEAVRQNLAPLHEYVAFKKEALKLKELHLYDVSVPLLDKEEALLPYEEAEALVIESVAPLGKEYQEDLAKGLIEHRWVDRYENKNKRSGAYSSGCFDSSPYILMNYRGTLRDVFTLAHEAGHSMHTLRSSRYQPFHYSRYSIFLAEVASIFNEVLLMDLLLKKRKRREERIYLLCEKLEDIRATLFRQTMFAEFELTIHELLEEGTPLTSPLLKERYLALNRTYFGKEVFIDEEIAIEWARIPHFYYNFYVYQYATGLSAAFALASRVLHGDSDACSRYLTFLSSGGSAPPLEILKRAGIDMTSPIPISEAIATFSGYLEQLKQELSSTSSV